MGDEAIYRAWIAEFGDDSHVSLHCYTLAYKAGQQATAQRCSEICNETWCGSDNCCNCDDRIAEAIRKEFQI